MLKLSATYFGTESDSATPMIIAHGLFGQSRNWRTLAERFADARRVTTLDMRNHGDSPWDPEMNYPAMGGDLLDAIDHHAGGRAILLGHSMGGKSAMAAALRQPDRVAALIVADIAPVAYTDHDHAPLIRALRAVDMSELRQRGDADAALRAAIPDPALRGFLLQNLVFEQTEGGRRAQWRLNLEALRAAMPDLMSWPTELNDRRYDGPALFLRGAESAYVTDESKPAIAALFPNADVVSMANAGHWLHAEQPEFFFNAASEWIASAHV